jgi:hypothetical protein
MRATILAAQLLLSARALDITGRVVLPLPSLRPGSSTSSTASSVLASPEDPQSLRVVLDGGASMVLPSPADGSFVFPDVGAGVHSVEAFHGDFLFSRFTVDAGAGGEPAVVAEHRYPGAPRLASSLPLEIAAAAQAQHWEDRPPSQVWGMLRNPMVLIGILMMGLMACVNAWARGCC